jgi:hypothetical protein
MKYACIMGLFYKNTVLKDIDKTAMDMHYDEWSSWNLLISVGGSSKLVYPRGEIVINSGDVILFNGNNKFHGVHLLPYSVNKLWNDYNKSKYHRFCFQLRICNK